MLLGSLLIPWIVGRSSKQAAVADTRLKQALQVMATSNGVDATINKIETAFEGFEKGSLLIEPQAEFLRRREDLRNRVYELMLSLIALLGGGHRIFMTKPAFSISCRRRVWTN